MMKQQSYSDETEIFDSSVFDADWRTGLFHQQQPLRTLKEKLSLKTWDVLRSVHFQGDDAKLATDYITAPTSIFFTVLLIFTALILF